MGDINSLTVGMERLEEAQGKKLHSAAYLFREEGPRSPLLAPPAFGRPPVTTELAKGSMDTPGRRDPAWSYQNELQP